MKNYWLLLFLALALGTTFGWAMNYVKYGRRTAHFGEFTADGSVTAENVMEILEANYSKSSAKAELEGEPNFDFGAMAPGSSGKHEFVVKNTGAEDLELTIGAATCKCTLGSLEDNLLGPGESTTVAMEWTVSTDKSTFSQSAELRTNDPMQPAIKLTISGKVIREIEFEPKKITFGEVASGEPFEIEAKMFSYLTTPIDIKGAQFGSESMTKLAEFEIVPFEPSKADGVHQRARQGFRIKAKVKEGLRQGAMVTTLAVSFNQLEKDSPNPTEVVLTKVEDGKLSSATECAGRIIGSLTMLENSKIKASSGGNYIWTVGRLTADDPHTVSGFVILKGNERDKTALSIGKVSPDDVISAEIGEPKGRGTMRMFPITVKFTPGEESIDLLGKNKEDFGSLWIDSDNPKVSSMRIGLKVALDPKP